MINVSLLSFLCGKGPPERETSVSWRRPTWIKCLFDPPPIQCPQDKGMKVKIYSPLSRVDTLKGPPFLVVVTNKFSRWYISIIPPKSMSSNVLNQTHTYTVLAHGKQCSKLKSSMPFERDLGLQNISLSKQPFETQPRPTNEDITWSPPYNLPATITNKRRALSLQVVEWHCWCLILHIVQYCKTCTILFMHEFNVSFVFRFYILGSNSWIWINPSTKGLKFGSPSKWNSYEGFNIDQWWQGLEFITNTQNMRAAMILDYVHD